MRKKNHYWGTDILLLTLTLGSLFFIFLGARPLFVPDEGRYAEIAREMILSGDYVTPYLNKIKYFEKPVLFYWLAAGAMKLGGLNLWAVRSVNALLGLAGCLLTYFTARTLYNRSTGLLAAYILGTSTLYFVMVHMVSLDLPVTVFLAACLYGFILGIQHPPGIKRRLYLWASAAMAALAVLTKGLIGIVFPGLIILGWIVVMGEWRLLKRLYFPSCILIFLAITLPWHWLVGQRNPEFFYFYFIEQHFLRYATKAIGHYQPSWFFIPYLLVGFFPWIIFLPQTLARIGAATWKNRQEQAVQLFFLLWILLIFTFFSFSKSKLIPYILPIFPPLAILTARYLQCALESHWNKGLKAGYIALLLLSVIAAWGFHHFATHAALPDPVMALRVLTGVAVILLLGAWLELYWIWTQQRLHAVITTIVTAWVFLLALLAAAPAIDARTVLPFAQILRPILQPGDEVVAYKQYYQDLPFYLQRRISVLNWRNELSFGMEHQDTRAWMLDNAAFWQLWHSERRVFAVMDLEEYRLIKQQFPWEHIYLISTTVNNVLVSNKFLTVNHK